jgi:glycosyltransferase involved in cell wall biosynthesis
VLEGLAAGRPVVASNTTSLPEAGGDAVVYFDPNAPEELASRIVEMAEPDRAGRFVEAGKRRAAHFTWRRSLEGLYSVYDEMLSSNGGV